MPNGGEPLHMVMKVSNYSEMVVCCCPRSNPHSFSEVRLYDRAEWDEENTNATPLQCIYGRQLNALVDFLKERPYVKEDCFPWHSDDIDAEFE